MGIRWVVNLGVVLNPVALICSVEKLVARMADIKIDKEMAILQAKGVKG